MTAASAALRWEGEKEVSSWRGPTRLSTHLGCVYTWGLPGCPLVFLHGLQNQEGPEVCPCVCEAEALSRVSVGDKPELKF